MSRKEPRGSFAAGLKYIELAQKRAKVLSARYDARFPKATETLGNGLEDSIAYYAFPEVNAQKISSTNMLERCNKEIRRRTNSVGIFPNAASYLQLVATYLMEYAED